MFWNKVPKGYVETVDGYLIKESEAKSINKHGKNVYYRKENAPAYDVVMSIYPPNFLRVDLSHLQYFKEVEVKEDGTPIGYHTQEEVQKLKDRIKELEDKYEPKNFIGELCGYDVYTTCGGGELFSEKPKPKNKSSKKKK